MHVFHFGESRTRLFGVYDAPPGGGRSGGVVLCAPLGHEYIRAHRALRTLAVRLTQAGLHVLRFDYYGTGDSAGSGEDGSLGQWQIDIGTAIDELKDMADVRRVSVIGVRFGATLAALACAARKDVDALVLWDPVMSGRGYVEQLLAIQATWLETRPRPREPGGRLTKQEVIGFPLTPGLHREFEATDLARLDRWPTRRLEIVESDDGAGELPAHLARAGVAHTARRVACDCRWQRPEAVHLALLAAEVVDDIVQTFDARVMV